MGELLILNNDFMRFNKEYFPVGKKTIIDATNINDKKVTFSAGNTVTINKLYSVELENTTTGEKLKLGFIFDMSIGSYWRIEYVERNNKIYFSPRFHIKYVSLVRDILSGLRSQNLDLAI